MSVVLHEVQPSCKGTCTLQAVVDGAMRREAGTGPDLITATAEALHRITGIALKVTAVTVVGTMAGDALVFKASLSVADGEWLAAVTGENSCPVHAAAIALVEGINKRNAYKGR